MHGREGRPGSLIQRLSVPMKNSQTGISFCHAPFVFPSTLTGKPTDQRRHKILDWRQDRDSTLIIRKGPQIIVR